MINTLKSFVLENASSGSPYHSDYKTFGLRFLVLEDATKHQIRHLS